MVVCTQMCVMNVPNDESGIGSLHDVTNAFSVYILLACCPSSISSSSFFFTTGPSRLSVVFVPPLKIISPRSAAVIVKGFHPTLNRAWFSRVECLTLHNNPLVGKIKDTFSHDSG